MFYICKYCILLGVAVLFSVVVGNVVLVSYDMLWICVTTITVETRVSKIVAMSIVKTEAV